MELDNKNTIVRKQLEGLQKKKATQNILLLFMGVLLVGIVGFMSFGNPSGDSIVTPDLPIQEWEIAEKPKSVLVSTKKTRQKEIVAVINPTKEQMARLKKKKEGRKIIRENRKRANKREVKQIELTYEEVIMLEEAEIVGTNHIFTESDLKKVEMEN